MSYAAGKCQFSVQKKWRAFSGWDSARNARNFRRARPTGNRSPLFLNLDCAAYRSLVSCQTHTHTFDKHTHTQQSFTPGSAVGCAIYH